MTRPGVPVYYRDSDVPCDLYIRDPDTNELMDPTGAGSGAEARVKQVSNAVALDWTVMTKIVVGHYRLWYDSNIKTDDEGEYSVEYAVVNGAGARKTIARAVFEVKDLPAVT